MSRLYGLDAVVDISHRSPVRDFTLARRNGRILGVIHKATEGVGWNDPLYTERRKQAEAAGLLWGAYHFGTKEYSGAEQARAFLSFVQPSPGMLIALDLEFNERRPGNTMGMWEAEEFVSTIRSATGRLPVLYTNSSWANGVPAGRAHYSLGGPIASNSILAACDLWLGDYRTAPQLPAAWAGKGWQFWQYAGDGGRGGPFSAATRGVAGIDHCDRNLCAAPDEASLRSYWAGRFTGV